MKKKISEIEIDSIIKTSSIINYMSNAIEILSRDIKDGDPYKGLLKIKNGEIVDYRYGMKKAKVVIHPVDLEGILTINSDGYEKRYKIRISYSSEDVFDLNRYMSYMKQKEIIVTNGKLAYVSKRKLERVIFSDLEFISSTDEIEEYFITELGVSPRVYKKLLSKSIIDKLDKKVKKAKQYIEELDKTTKKAEKIMMFADRIMRYIPASISSINEVSKEYTGISFEEIAKLSDEEANKYINKIATDISTAYLQIYNDRLGAKIIYSLINTALSRARENYYSDNIRDYLIINENYNEIEKITKEKVTNEFSKIKLIV